MGSTFGNSTRCSLGSGVRHRPRPSSVFTLRATPYTLDAAPLYSSTVPPKAQHDDLRDSAACIHSKSPCRAWAAPIGPLEKPRPTPPQVRRGRRLKAKAIASTSPARQPTNASLFARGVARGRTRVQPLPVPHATAAGAEIEDTQQEVLYTSSSGLAVSVRKIRMLDELRQVATLRADAYYAENQSRFVGSLKKKYVEQEVESLQQRTTVMSRQGKPYSECLVALDPSSGAVLACIDVRLPAALNGTHPHGVPPDDPHGCYLLNVVVREDVRGQGLGRGVMRAAMARAVHVWGARQLYTHVEADNEVAFRLYCSCGFAQHSADSKYEAASKLGQTLLLQASASAAPPAQAAAA